MSTHSLCHLTDQVLLDHLASLVATDRRTTAALLAHIAEVDARKLFLPAACSSMHVYCVQVLHLSEDAAGKRISAARAARRFPAIFDAIADGRLHLSAVVMLAPHLTDERAGELLAAATHRSKAEIALLLARWHPVPDVPDLLHPLPPPPAAGSSAPGRVGADASAPPRNKLAPLAPERFALQLTIDQATHDKLVRARALLRHRVPSGDLAHVLDRALDALLDTLAREKFAATKKPRRGRSGSGGGDPRHIPHGVKRAVHVRDGECCAFVSADGVRCRERGFLEFDHVDPVARGGQPTCDRTRLLCRSHNQYEAEQAFGVEFMQQRRAQARTAPAATRDVAALAVAAPGFASELESETITGLRGLGFTAAEARDAVVRSAARPAATLEERLRAALAVVRTRHPSRCSESRRVVGWGGHAGATALAR